MSPRDFTVLDTASALSGFSKSVLIRKALTAFLKNRKELHVQVMDRMAVFDAAHGTEEEEDE